MTWFLRYNGCQTFFSHQNCFLPPNISCSKQAVPLLSLLCAHAVAAAEMLPSNFYYLSKQKKNSSASKFMMYLFLEKNGQGALVRFDRKGPQPASLYFEKDWFLSSKCCTFFLRSRSCFLDTYRNHFCSTQAVHIIWWKHTTVFCVSSIFVCSVVQHGR